MNKAPALPFVYNALMPETPLRVELVALSFGGELRKQREIRGISLREISDSTKISKRFLEAMEQDQFRALPAPVFTRGFIREYARYLGLSSDEMITRYEDYLHSTEASDPVAPRPLAPGPFPAVSRASRRRLPSWVALGGALLVGAVIASAVIYMTRKTPPIVSQAAVAAATMAPPPVVVSSSQADTSVTPPVSGVVLKIHARESSWIELLVDGQLQPEHELQPGQERTYHAREHFEFRTIGNAGGLELTVNGRPIPPLGPSGRVLHDVMVDGSGAGQPRSR
jgi:cytoskeleton protein RodZ